VTKLTVVEAAQLAKLHASRQMLYVVVYTVAGWAVVADRSWDVPVCSHSWTSCGGRVELHHGGAFCRADRMLLPSEGMYCLV